ncbi:MAG: DUF2764 domain-containing protein [Bacteroidota bacterium]|jgi:hypothetical protein|nr:DUF2764 domain-containing protein [Bacteroidota bacterium]
MANYPYIIASFPDMVLDYERHPVDEKAVVAEVKGLLSESDGKLVDWLEFGLEGTKLKPHFYRGIRNTGCRFLVDWFDYDRHLRLAKVDYLENKPYQVDFPELEKAAIIFQMDNLAQREKLLDRLNWDKAAELVEFDVFSIDMILSLLVRLHIATRWSRLDPKAGASLFQQFVDEVRGTFQGINAEQL